jgi:hypothetical protein
MIVSKAVNMTRKMDVRVLGVIENMSYIICPECGKKIRMFQGNRIDEFLKGMELKLIGELPMQSSICGIEDNGFDSLDEGFKSMLEPITEILISRLSEE